MIPIKIEKENLNISNLEDLEYKYLVEVPKEIRVKYEVYCVNYADYDVDNNRLLLLFTENKFDVYRYIGKTGESNLFTSEGNLYTANQDKDFLFYNGGYGDSDFGFIITDEVLKDMVGKRLDVDWRDSSSVIEIFEKYENKEIGIGDFIQRFLAYGFKREDEQKREKKKREIEREEEIKGNELEIKEFDSGGWKTNDGTYGSKNIIHHYGGEYTFDEDFNKVFTIEELNNGHRGHNGNGNLSWIENLSVEKSVSYSFVSKDKKRTYSVKFKDDKMYVDKVCVPKVRSAFFISRASGDTEKLKILKELSAIKVEFLALTSITLTTDSYTYKNIPIEVKYADKLWEVTFMDKSIKVDWKDLELFRYNTQSLRNIFGTRDINSIRELFGISKEELFDFMKKTQLLDKLGEED